MGKLVCEQTVNGEQVLRNITTAAGVVGTLVKTTPGVGKPFWYWPTLPAGKIIGADFTNAPIASEDAATNNAAAAGITTPADAVLIFDAP